MLGPHVKHLDMAKLRVLERWQPAIVTVLEPNPNEVRDLRKACPNTTVIGRIYHPDNEYTHRIMGNPTDAARWAHASVMEYAQPEVDYYVTNNEVCQQWHQLENLKSYTDTWMRLADSNGYKCAILTWSVGNPGDVGDQDGWKHWARFEDTLRYANDNGHIANYHSYGWPGIFEPDAAWYVLRQEEKIIPRLIREFGLNKLKFAVTELGIDGLIDQHDRRKKGWRTFDSPASYVNQLLEYEKRVKLYPFADKILGATIFCYGDSGGWHEYEISGEVVDLLANHYHDNPTGNQHRTFIPTIRKEPDSPKDSTGTVSIERRLTDSFEALNMKILPVPDGDSEHVYVLRDFFTTHDGSWKVGAKDTPYWLKDQWPWEYNQTPWGRTGHFDDAGAQQNILAHVVDGDGRPLDADIKFYTLKGNGETDIIDVRNTAEKASKWQNQAVWNLFYPTDGQSGAWHWGPTENAEIIVGGGLPANNHISMFAVWQKVKRTQAIDSGSTVDQQPPASPSDFDIVVALSRVLDIEERVARAVLAIESGGRAFGDDGRMIIRLELHILRSNLKDKSLFDEHFRINGQKPWQGHQVYLDGQWQTFHGNQAMEWEAFELARSIDERAATMAISMGSAQIMGFNYAVVGYGSPQEMFADYSGSEDAQTTGFFAYCNRKPGLIEAMRHRDWRKIARLYNGSGAIDTYAPLLEKAYREQQ